MTIELFQVDLDEWCTSPDEDLAGGEEGGQESSGEQADGDQGGDPGDAVMDGVDKEDNPNDDAGSSGDLLGDADGSAKEGVPDKYTFDPPEGATELTEEQLAAFDGAARDAGLTQDQFQKLVEFDLQRSKEADEALKGQWGEVVSGWQSAAKADAVLKAEGGFDANLALVRKAVKEYGDAELSALLRSPSEDNPQGLGVGNHPAFLRLMARVARATVSEDPQVGGDPTARSSGLDLDMVYPSMAKRE